MALQHHLSPAVRLIRIEIDSSKAPHTVPKRVFPHPLLVSLAISASLMLLSGCGSSGSGSLARIEGSSASIGKATLNHWMRAMAGEDFRQSVGTKGPQGLVSEPANYSECATAARRIVPRTFTGQLKLSGAQIALKCRELYRSIKAQALSFLISVQWSVAEGAEHGIKISDALLHSEFARYRKQVYPTEADLQKYLAERRLVLSDILYELKRAIVVTRMLPKFEEKIKKAGGGDQAYAKLVLEREKGLIAKTKCAPGYVVPNCKEYDGPPTVAPAPNVILEQFVQARSG